jgi:hypothetical protein
MSQITHVLIEHYVMTKAVCEEIAHIKQQRNIYRKTLTKGQRREVKAYRHRFDNQYNNPTLVLEGLKAFAADCFEPVNLRDNGIIQSEWRRDNLPPLDVHISYE